MPVISVILGRRWDRRLLEKLVNDFKPIITKALINTIRRG